MKTLFPHDLAPHPECHVASVQLWNYKAAADVKLELGQRLHVFIGDNGAGKTTVLDGIASGLAAVAGKLGAKLGAERFELREETVRRRDGEIASNAAVAVRMGSGWSIRKMELHGQTLPVFASDYYTPPVFQEASAEQWFNARWLAAKNDAHEQLPVFAYYTADRANLSRPANRRTDSVPRRWEALNGAFAAATSYADLVAWFSVMEAAELYEMRRRDDTSYRDPVVEGVREAVRRIVPGITNVSFHPMTGQLRADTRGAAGANQFAIDELSGGRRVMLAMVADLARRMMQANAHLGLESPAVVLIDELDLHLHPKWQSDVVGDLMGTFPNAQFIVTTHSELILGAVPSSVVRAVRSEQDGVRAYSIGPVEGARPERIQEDAMGLETVRNKAHQERLDRYWALVDAGDGESVEGLELRAELDELYQGREPELARADVVIRRMRARKGER